MEVGSSRIDKKNLKSFDSSDINWFELSWKTDSLNS